MRAAILDPKGEMAAVFGPGLIHRGARVYIVNPYGLHGLPNHAVSLFSHLKSSSSTLVADSFRAARNWVPASGTGDNRYFEQKGQYWTSYDLRGLVHADGSVSPRSLLELVGMRIAAPDAWAEMSESMAALGEPDLGVAFAEMREMARSGERVYASITSEQTNALAPLADPAIQSSFVGQDEAEFSLDVLTEDSDQDVFVFLVMPDDLITQNAAVIRQFFSTLRTLKQRKPHSPTINLIIDEAARLGKFPEIAEWYAIGRGFALSPFCAYQDISQIRENLGPNGVATLTANADVEIYLGGGISDLETAQHLSRKLGNQTLHLPDTLTQERAARAKREAVHAMLHERADPFKTGMALRALDAEMRHTRKQARALMSPDEILAMPRDKALVLASGYDLRPFLVDRVPYFARPSMAGRYFPNPFHDRGADAVRVRTRWGTRRRRVIREAVPECFADFPQYKTGEWQFIAGYRPKTE